MNHMCYDFLLDVCEDREGEVVEVCYLCGQMYACEEQNFHDDVEHDSMVILPIDYFDPSTYCYLPAS